MNKVIVLKTAALFAALFLLPAHAMEPRSLPDYQARLLGSDRNVRFSDLQGQVLLINAWATWCSPCRAEMPDFESVYQRLRDRGLTVIGINIDEGQADEAVASFVNGLGVSFPIWRDPNNRFSKRFRSIGVVPETYLVNRRGIIVKHWQGPMDPNADDNFQLIQAVLNEADTPSEPVANAAAKAKRGKRIAEQRGCLTCHSTDGSSGPGPTWLGLIGSEAQLTNGRRIVRNHAYLKRAIDDPDAEIVAGYSAGMMSGAMPGKKLTASEIDALLLYLESLTN